MPRAAGARRGVCYDDGHETQGERVGRGVHVHAAPATGAEGGYTETSPTLLGLVTYGETLEEARVMAADAIRGYIECLREDGEPVPKTG